MSDRRAQILALAGARSARTSFTADAVALRDEARAELGAAEREVMRLRGLVSERERDLETTTATWTTRVRDLECDLRASAPAAVQTFIAAWSQRLRDPALSVAQRDVIRRRLAVADRIELDAQDDDEAARRVAHLTDELRGAGIVAPAPDEHAPRMSAPRQAAREAGDAAAPNLKEPIHG